MLFVCTGNSARSPIAEALLRLAPPKTAESARIITLSPFLVAMLRAPDGACR